MDKEKSEKIIAIIRGIKEAEEKLLDRIDSAYNNEYGTVRREMRWELIGINKIELGVMAAIRGIEDFTRSKV